MRYSAVFTTLFALAAARPQVGIPSPGGEDCDPNPSVIPEDKLRQFDPAKVKWPCKFAAEPIPMGPAPTGCSDYEIIVARGTSEPGPFGVIVGDPLMARMEKGVPDWDLRGYAVQYPAAATGVEIGGEDIVNRLKSQSEACPDQTFALVGYSQGGRTIGLAAPEIPEDIQKKVVQIVLYGANTGKSLPEWAKAKLLSNCAPGDFGCGATEEGPGHLSYNNIGTTWHDHSAHFIASAFEGNPMPAEFNFNPQATNPEE